MPLYEYEYTDAAGRPRRIEARFPIGEAPAQLPFEIPEQGRTYTARRVFSPPSLPADGTYSYKAGARG